MKYNCTFRNPSPNRSHDLSDRRVRNSNYHDLSLDLGGRVDSGYFRRVRQILRKTRIPTIAGHQFIYHEAATIECYRERSANTSDTDDRSLFHEP